MEPSEGPVGLESSRPQTPRSVPAAPPRPAREGPPPPVEAGDWHALGPRAAARVERAHAALAWHPWSDLALLRDPAAREGADGFRRAHLVVAGGGEGCDGLVVAALGDERVPWRVGRHVLGRSRARVLRVATGGVLGLTRTEPARLAARALLDVLEDGEADLLYLHETEPDQPLLAELDRAVRPRQRDRGRRRSTGWLLDLPATYEAFRTSLSRKARANLNGTANRMRRALGEGLRVVCHRGPEALPRLIADTEHVARSSYHRRMGVGFADTAAVRRSLAFQIEAGWLRAWVLYADGQPIAFNHGLVYRRTFFGRHTGFDPEMAALRPGAFLQACVLEDLCREGNVDRVDFGVMDGDLKRALATRPYERVSAFLFAPTLRGARLAAARAATGLVERTARRVVDAARARRRGRGPKGGPGRTEEGDA